MTTFEQIPPGDEFWVSATLFVTYRKCPQQALARLRGVYPPTTKQMFRGLLAHRLFARHLKEGPIGSEEFEIVCRRETGAHLGASMASLALKPSEYRAITHELESLYDRFKTLPTDGFDDAEVEVSGDLAEGIHLRGRVDAVFAVNEGERIVDWKTGGYLDDAEPQLAFYAMAWKRTRGTIPSTVEAVSLATGETRVRRPTEADVAATEADVAAMIVDLRTALADRAEADRTAGPHCRWCPLLEDCTEGQTAVEILS